MAHRWYVVHVYSGFERKIAQSLKEQAVQKGMDKLITDVLVPAEEVVSTLVPLFVYFKSARNESETFGDFCHRKGAEDLRAWAEQYAVQTAAT